MLSLLLDCLRVSTYKLLAFTDPLTRARNRHYLSELDLSKFRYLTFADINGLGRINKTQGHLAGDKHIVFCANLLRAAMQPGDVIIRYGGDEFLILSQTPMPDSDHYSLGRANLEQDFSQALQEADANMLGAKRQLV